jgi:hypothetical protein
LDISGSDVKKRIWMIVALGIVGLSLATCGGSRSTSSGTSASTTGRSTTSTALTGSSNGVECSRTTRVPNVIGKTVQTAKISLGKACLYLSINYVVFPGFEAPLGTPGFAATQSLPAGITTSSFRVVVVTVCTYGNAR